MIRREDAPFGSLEKAAAAYGFALDLAASARALKPARGVLTPISGVKTPFIGLRGANFGCLAI